MKVPAAIANKAARRAAIGAEMTWEGERPREPEAADTFAGPGRVFPQSKPSFANSVRTTGSSHATMSPSCGAAKSQRESPVKARPFRPEIGAALGAEKVASSR